MQEKCKPRAVDFSCQVRTTSAAPTGALTESLDMTQHTASNCNSNSSSPSSTRRSRRAGLVALAALGMPLGAMLAPGSAAAAPGDSLGDIDILLPIEDFIPLSPVLPIPVPPIPIPFPVGPSIPDDVPGPDDGPGLPFELPELDDPFDLFPFDPDDLVLPTDPLDPIGPGDDDDGPECAEYSAANFTADAEHHEGDLIELRLMYSDMDVCDFTVWTAVAEPGAVGVLGETTAGMKNIAFSTDSAGYYQQTWMHHDLCDLEIRVAVEESLAFTVPHTDPGCVDEIPEPGDDGDEPEDDGDEPEDDGDEPEDDGDEPEDDGDEPEDDGEDTPEEARPLGEPETPETPSGGLPQTGTDMTTIMFAIGLMTLGAGSVIALATRRREELPIA